LISKNEIDKKFKFPSWAKILFKKSRFKILHGGRGGGKSYNVADFLLLVSMTRSGTILCARQFQNSMADSVHSLLASRISELKLDEYFYILKTEIICKLTRTRFIFKGLERNVGSIKSIHNLIYCWIEEAAYVSKTVWELLVPSVRGAIDAEIICTFNPWNKTDVIYKEFIVHPDERAIVRKVTYRDNPYFAEPLIGDRVSALKRMSPAEYNHIWEGEVLEHSDAQIFKDKWIVADFTDDKRAYKYFGLDFGFSTDPLAAIRCYIVENTLYITHEVYEYGLEIDKIKDLCLFRLPDFKNSKVIGDSANPSHIDYLKRQGIRIEGAVKGKSSVEYGIDYIRNFDKVIIHSRCVNTIQEFTKYSYRIDQRSGDITTEIIDKHNHAIDALRYALERCGKVNNFKAYEVLRRQRNAS
jgi:phage terminase large subunit